MLRISGYIFKIIRAITPKRGKWCGEESRNTHIDRKLRERDEATPIKTFKQRFPGFY